MRKWILRVVLAWLAITILPVLILRFVPPPTSAFMVERQIHYLLSDQPHPTIHYVWTPWRRLSPQLKLAVVASEDQTFPVNWGFDFQAIGNAIEHNEDHRHKHGASTITQQLARNLFLCSCRSWVRKGIEAYFTVLLEAFWSKRRILEVYLNVAEFGDGIYGAGAASRIYFHQPPSRLTRVQASLLAAVLPSPRRWHVDRPSDFLLARAANIREQMDNLGSGYLAPLQ